MCLAFKVWVKVNNLFSPEGMVSHHLVTKYCYSTAITIVLSPFSEMDICTVIQDFSVHENIFTPIVNNYGLRKLCNIHKIASECIYMFFYRIYLWLFEFEFVWILWRDVFINDNLTLDFSNFILLSVEPTIFRMSQHDRDQEFGKYLN